MRNRVEEKELCKVAEFVFVYDKDNLWISLEFLGKNKIRLCFNKLLKFD